MWTTTPCSPLLPSLLAIVQHKCGRFPPVVGHSLRQLSRCCCRWGRPIEANPELGFQGPAVCRWDMTKQHWHLTHWQRCSGINSWAASILTLPKPSTCNSPLRRAMTQLGRPTWYPHWSPLESSLTCPYSPPNYRPHMLRKLLTITINSDIRINNIEFMYCLQPRHWASPFLSSTPTRKWRPSFTNRGFFQSLVDRCKQYNIADDLHDALYVDDNNAEVDIQDQTD